MPLRSIRLVLEKTFGIRGSRSRLPCPIRPNPTENSVRHQLEGCPNTIGCIGLWQSLSDALRRTPAGAMSRDYHRWIDLPQSFDRRCNDGLDQGSRQMKSPEHSIHLLHPSLRARLVDNINHPGMSTARNYHQALVAHMDDQSLVVIHPRVRLPGAIDLGLL